MFTLELENSIIINRPVDEVFAYMDDIFWGYIPKPIVRRIYNRTLKQNMARLKQVLESEAPAQ